MRLLWTDHLSVGIKEFDDDHKRLIGMINQLHGALQAGETLIALGTVIDQLDGYVRSHCTREELMFLETGYPDAAAHEKEHRELFGKLTEIKSRYESNPSRQLAIDAIELLHHWLTEHIYGTDKKYSSYLHSKGIF